MATEIGVNRSSVSRIRSLIRHNLFDAFLAKTQEREARKAGLPPKTPKQKPLKQKPVAKKPTLAQLAAKAERMEIEAQLKPTELQTLNLARKGYIGVEIAKKIGASQPSVYTYIKKLRKLGLLVKGEHTNGTGSVAREHLDPKICIGIAYAEVERFIGHLSERLGVPATILRPRLSELLGRSALR